MDGHQKTQTKIDWWMIGWMGMMMLHHTPLELLDKSSKCVELNPCNASASDLVVVHSSVAALNH